MALKTIYFAFCGPPKSLPLVGTAKGERTKTGTVKNGKKKQRKSRNIHMKKGQINTKSCHMIENFMLVKMAVLIFKLEVALNQESSATVQKKDYVWDHMGNPCNNEIKYFFRSFYDKFNSASNETN